MAVLLVAEQLRRPTPGGIGTYVRELARALPDAVTLWASRGDALPFAPTLTSPLPSEALVWAWDRGFGSAWTRPPAGFDVVHAPSLAVPPRPGGGTPMAVTVHDLAWRRVPETFPPRGRRWHEAALGRALARADVLVAPSQQTADDLVAAGAPAARVEIAEEGSDHLPPPDLLGARTFLAGHGVLAEAGYLLTVSTLEPRKNLTRLAAAYAAAAPRLPERWPLVVVGPKGWGDAVKPAPPRSSGVILAGPVPDAAILAGLYASARLVATVPLVEGFGLPAVEAMAAGAPVVASPQPSTGGAAYEVDPLDVDAIADALVRVATDEPRRADLVAAGKARTAELTWAAAAARHTEIYGSLRSRAGHANRGQGS